MRSADLSFAGATTSNPSSAILASSAASQQAPSQTSTSRLPTVTAAESSSKTAPSASEGTPSATFFRNSSLANSPARSPKRSGDDQRCLQSRHQALTMEDSGVVSHFSGKGFRSNVG